MTDEKKRSFIINVLYWLAVVFLVFVAFRYLFSWLFPFAIGALVAVALQKPIDWLTRKTKFPRAVWALGLSALTFTVLGVVAFFTASRLFAELINFFKTLPNYAPALQNWLSGVSERLQNALSEFPPDMVNQMTDSLVKAPTNIANNLAAWSGGLAGRTVLELPNLLISVIITVVATCFVTKDYHEITAFFRRQIRPQRWEIISEAKSYFVTNTLKMLRGYIFIMFITFVELALGLSMLRVRYAVVIALLISLLDILPVLGTGSILIPWGIISIAMGDYFTGTGVLVTYGVVTVVRYIAEPRIIGRQVGLKPIVTLFAMYIGLRFFGLVGLFGFPITLIIIQNMQDSGRFRIWK
ncbi:MAG: sporulation integral membrane protein YtvI [Oscillospiraceae bacterium]|nr:sporulation integral membrane protein YtvI [Oscillospiraceae bacterium]